MKTTVRTKIMTILGTVAAAGTLAGGIAATAPLARADTGSGPRAITAANLRIGPSTHVGIRAVVQAGDPLAIACVSPGTAVDDNRDWYALTDQKGWISATLVEGAGEVEPCHGGVDGLKAITSADVNVRRGPSTLDESVGILGRGTTVTVVCGAKGEVIDDAHRWFLLAGGNWVTGAYLPSVPPEDTPDCDA
ncbi:hypothetical protein [Microlunatus sp. GCM10028923]|uniref:hypothetical protein n=1 Tax=Microlunatus sp. GCM10028923 TaxID=3273400 RepID=UPI003606A8C0